jgi:hypothetical protein
MIEPPSNELPAVIATTNVISQNALSGGDDVKGDANSDSLRWRPNSLKSTDVPWKTLSLS